jgi:uncharacterized membrane protein YkoI
MKTSMGIRLISAVLGGLAISVTVVLPAAGAGPGIEPGSLVGQCQASVQRTFPGKVRSISANQEGRRLVYEFEGTAADDSTWRAECDSVTLKVTEVEREVVATDAAFAKQAKVDEAAARRMCVSAFPGEVVATRYIIESDGAAVYEFDIATGRDVLVRIEVDAGNGWVVEVNPLIWSMSIQ